MELLIVVLVSYLLGTSSMSYYLAKLNQVDIQNKGSKNLGASNAMILMGWKAGILVAVHDAGKALLAIVLAKVLFQNVAYAAEAAGVASVVGHVFPFWLKFKGGKGLASFIGMALGLNVWVGIGLIVLLFAVMLITDYIVLGTVSVIIGLPLIMAFVLHNPTGALIVLIATALIGWKHRENYVRIYNGTEIRFRKANKGEYREKK
ncbi:MAG: glycerol-3-phosphate acyltransferase [Erysipelotrichaceae bacterium]|nr:glycerol-3-phosphate acyltransferase [Erysipelotrichaceae bacterium]